MRDVICERCGGAFAVTAALYRWREDRLRPIRYCSKACHDAALDRGVVTLRCQQCGNDFQRRKGKIRKDQRNGCQHVFCSRTCSAASGLRRALVGYRHIAKRDMPDITLTGAQAGYIAGLIDGEGSFSLYPTRNGRSMNVSMTITNTDRRLLDWCRDASGVGALIAQKRRDYTNRRLQYVWAVNARNDLRALLPQVIPALVGKAEQAKVVLRYCEARAACEVVDVNEYAGVVPRLNARAG